MSGQPKIEFERGGHDRLVPKDFAEILSRRLFPVLSLVYISTVVGIAAEKGSILHYVFEDKTAYVMALLVALWVSVPAVLWIILRGCPFHRHVADDWYKIAAALQIITMLLLYILFPEFNILGLKIYFAASLPVLFIIYFFFVKGGLPAAAAHPLTAAGLALLIYGGVVNFLY